MATFTHAVKSVSLETRPLVLLLILMNFISDGTCQNITLSCPLLQENSITQFNCSVLCAHLNVYFDFERKDTTTRILCDFSSSNTCDQTSTGEMTCGCVLSNSGVKYYQLNFLGNKTKYDQGKLTCNANCFPVPDGAVCQPLRFASPSTSTSTTIVYSAVTTSHSPSASTPSNSSSTETGNKAGNGNSMHALRTGIVASMSGIIALISTHLS